MDTVQATVPTPAAVDVPVTVTIGDTVLNLGTARVATPPRAGAIRAAVGNLLATAARVVQHDDDAWPRQAYWVGDTITLPGSVARGVVVQVDRRTKCYRVDTGKTRPVSVFWADVDPMASRCSLAVGDLVRAVGAYARGRGDE